MPDVIQGTDHRPLIVGQSLFDYADAVSSSVPQSCRRTGRCRECVVEVRQGLEGLSPRTLRRGLSQGWLSSRLPGDDRGHHRRRRVRDHPPAAAHPGLDRDPGDTPRPGGHRGRHDGLLRRSADRSPAEPRPRTGHRHRHHDRGLPDHRPADGRGGRRRRAGESAAVRRQRRHDPDLVRAGLPGRDAPGRPARHQPRPPRPVPRARDRPARGVRGDRRGEQHDARPVLRHRHPTDRGVPVQVDHRGGDAGRPVRFDVGAAPRSRGRAADEPVRPRRRGAGHRQPCRRRHGSGPRGGRVRQRFRHPDAHRHRHEHRGRRDRRHALPGRLVPRRPGLRRRAPAVRDAGGRRRHRIDPPRRRQTSPSGRSAMSTRSGSAARVSWTSSPSCGAPDG